MFKAYKKFWKNYVNFGGTSDRPDYWWVMLFNLILGLIFYIILFAVGAELIQMGTHGASQQSAAAIGATALIVMLVAFAYGIATFIPGLSITIRRYRDTGLNPWWFAIVPVAWVLSVVMVISAANGDRWAALYFWVSMIFYVASMVITLLPTNFFNRKKQA
ncbi:DUF805 domain-containing protein [Lactobacillaceae bacterium L1_55_11]|nr:DUF805 domain-containing protein [Lactobacillaceae bacterium L1_55_11]